ncbi:NusG domain II-containing protein [Pelosinus sp. sgz500959]|uniref:NusG domain II-containing protein n=1 Tax=Pelosinus sp. sgz500959 TaxID=3242472 RepID=UPI003672AC7A
MKNFGLTLADKWLIGVVILFSIIGIGLSIFLFPTQGDTIAEIRVDSKLVKAVTLRKGYSEEFRIGGQKEYAVIEVQDGRIRIRQDDSPRQIGVQTGWISKPPQQVVNLPYRIVINLVSNESLDVDDIAR